MLTPMPGAPRTPSQGRRAASSRRLLSNSAGHRARPACARWAPNLLRRPYESSAPGCGGLILETLGEAMLQACIAAAPRQATVDTLLVDIQDDAASDGARLDHRGNARRRRGSPGLCRALRVRTAHVFQRARSGTRADRSGTGRWRLARNPRRSRATTRHRRTARATAGDELPRRARDAVADALAHPLATRRNRSQPCLVGFPQQPVAARRFRPSVDQSAARPCKSIGTRLERRFGLIIGLASSLISAAGIARSRHRFAHSSPRPSRGRHRACDGPGRGHELLWPREAELRQRVLQSYNPYRSARTTDPALVRHLLLPGRSRRSVHRCRLARRSSTPPSTRRASAGSWCDAAMLQRCAQRWSDSSATPVDVGFLQFFPAIERVERPTAGSSSA